MNGCEREMCPYWAGSGCVCAVMDIQRPGPGCENCGRLHIREECLERNNRDD